MSVWMVEAMVGVRRRRKDNTVCSSRSIFANSPQILSELKVGERAVI